MCRAFLRVLRVVEAPTPTRFGAQHLIRRGKSRHLSHGEAFLWSGRPLVAPTKEREGGRQSAMWSEWEGAHELAGADFACGEITMEQRISFPT